MNFNEKIYRVVLIKGNECILTPGELNLDTAKKKSSYLSQYGQVALFNVHQLKNIFTDNSFITSGA